MKHKQKKADQEVNIWSLPKGSAGQEVNVNPPGGRPPEKPHYAPGTERLGVAGLLLLLIVLAVCAFLVISACGMASALTAGSIW
jgi:hypothetical protein